MIAGITTIARILFPEFLDYGDCGTYGNSAIRRDAEEHGWHRAPPRALHEGHRENRHREQDGDEGLRVAGEIVVDHGVPSFH